MAHDPIENIPTPSTNEVNLDIASIIVHAILFPAVVFITWKHGKAGIVCWPIFASFFIFRFLSNGWQLSIRDKPDIPNAVSIFTNAGIVTCLTLALIGVVYEAGVILAPVTSLRVNRALIGMTHLLNTVGIAIATYGGSPSQTNPDGIASSAMNKTGHCLMLLVILLLTAWLFWMGRCISASRIHPNLRNAKILVFTGCIGLPFQTIRIIYATTYAFRRIPSLDPDMGSFLTRFVLMFLMELAVTIALTAGGWLSRAVNDTKASRTRSNSLELVDSCG